jgi:Spy/CpxP family protein refolding chaperone
MTSIKQTLLTLSAVALLSATTIAAQGRGHFGPEGRMGGGLATALDLTDAQKTQAKTIFDTERQSTKPLMQQLQTQRQSVDQAIQGGKSAEEVSAIAAQQGSLLGQLEGVRASARQQFYSILTPAQQKKYLALEQQPHHGPGATGPSSNE